MAPLQTMMRANGVDLNVIDTGGGTSALVFLHYWGGSSRTWMPVIGHLSGQHRCVAIDFRGWGKSTQTATDHSLATLATDVLAVIDKLGLEEFVLLGHSMGGKVAQLVAAMQPAGLNGLVLFAPAPPTPMSVPEEERRGYVGLYQSRQAITDFVLAALTPHALGDAAREQIIEDTIGGSAAAKEEWPLRGMVTDISAAVSRIAVPVHVIAGGDDRVEPEASLRAAFGKALSQVTFAVVPGVGHIAPLEDPARLAEAIRDGVARTGWRPHRDAQPRHFPAR